MTRQYSFKKPNSDQEGDALEKKGMSKWKGIISLCLLAAIFSLFLPWFAFIPLILVFLRYGAQLGLLATLGVTLFSSALFTYYLPAGANTANFVVFWPSAMALFFGTNASMSLAVYAIIKKRLHPSKSFIGLACFFMILFWAVLFAFSYAIYHTHPVEAVEILMRAGVKMIPQELATHLQNLSATSLQEYELPTGPDFLLRVSYFFFLSFFFATWFGIYSALRNSLLWRFFQDYPYFTKDFLALKLPAFILYIGLFAMAIVAIFWWNEQEDWIKNLSYAQISYDYARLFLVPLGILCFLQGLSLLIQLLDVWGIQGFLRPLILIVALIFLVPGLSIVGLFDNWFNIDQKINKNPPQGEGENV